LSIYGSKCAASDFFDWAEKINNKDHFKLNITSLEYIKLTLKAD
jgi:hypothetical protein